MPLWLDPGELVIFARADRASADKCVRERRVPPLDRFDDLVQRLLGSGKGELNLLVIEEDADDRQPSERWQGVRRPTPVVR